MWWGVGMLDALVLNYNQWKQEADNTLFLLQLRALEALLAVILDKLRAHLWTQTIIIEW